MQSIRSLILVCLSFFCIVFAEAQPVAYNGQQDLRPTFMGVVYEIEGGDYDGQRGYLFRIWNRESFPVELSTIPDQFSQPVEAFLGVGAQYSNGTYSFAGDEDPYRPLFASGPETLNPSPSGGIDDRPANFIAIVDPSVDTIVFTLRGRTATGAYAAAQVQPLSLNGGATPNVSITFTTDGLTYEDFLDAVGQNAAPGFDIGSDVYVDGTRIGSIPETGPLPLFLQPGEHSIAGAIEQLIGGSQSVAIEAGQTYDLVIDMTGEGLSGILPYSLLVNDSSTPVIAPTAAEFRIDFVSPEGAKYSLDQPFRVHAVRVQTDLLFDGPPKRVSALEDLTGFFQLHPSGHLSAQNPAAVIAALETMGAGPYELVVSANEVIRGLPLTDSIVVRLEKFALNGDIVPLPSSAAFSPGGIIVTASSMTGGVERTATSSSTGAFSFGLLPEDTYRISAVTELSEEILAVEGYVSLTEPAQLALTPLTTTQTASGDQGFVIVSGASATNSAGRGIRGGSPPTEQRMREQKNQLERRGAPPGRPSQTIRSNSTYKPVARPDNETKNADGAAPLQLVNPEFYIQISSVSGTTQTESLQVEVPGSQASVSLGYYVGLSPGSATFREFPDFWAIQLRDQNGAILFSTGNTFSTSIRSPSLPLFFSDSGSYGTDYITETVSLPPSQTPANDRILTLTVTASTSYDSEIFASILAEFLDVPLIRIVSSGAAVSNAPATRRFPDIPGSVVGFPDTGDRNTFNIRLPITIERIDTGASIDPGDITALDVDVVFGAAGAAGGAVVFSQTAPIAQLQRRPASEVYELDVSFIQPTPASPVATAPPAESEIAYRISVQASVNGEPVGGEGFVRGLTGLYRTAQPLGLVRTGMRDNGGDDWAQKGLYDWLSDNSNLIAPMNDISGEHGRDLGHSSHRLGLDLDMNFFDAAQPGSVEHVVLTNNVILAIQGNQASLAAVSDYIINQQVGIEALAAQNVLSNVFGPVGGARAVPAANGQPDFSLANGWAGTLFESGIVRDSGGNTLLNINRSMNAAASALFSPYPGHNDHLHLTFLADAL